MQRGNSSGSSAPHALCSTNRQYSTHDKNRGRLRGLLGRHARWGAARAPEALLHARRGMLRRSSAPRGHKPGVRAWWEPHCRPAGALQPQGGPQSPPAVILRRWAAARRPAGRPGAAAPAWGLPPATCTSVRGPPPACASPALSCRPVVRPGAAGSRAAALQPPAALSAASEA